MLYLLLRQAPWRRTGLHSTGETSQNTYIERFNRSYRTEVLDCYVFSSLVEVGNLTEDWLKRYNKHRPHESLGNIPPRQFLMQNAPNFLF